MKRSSMVSFERNRIQNGSGTRLKIISVASSNLTNGVELHIASNVSSLLLRDSQGLNSNLKTPTGSPIGQGPRGTIKDTKSKVWLIQ